MPIVDGPGVATFGAGQPVLRHGNSLLRCDFSLVQQGFQPVNGSKESVLVRGWDSRFDEVLQEDFDVGTSHRTRQITTAFSLHFSWEP